VGRIGRPRKKRFVWRPYTMKELQFIRDNYHKIPAAEIGTQIGRSKFSVRRVAQQDLGISHEPPRAWTTQELLFAVDAKAKGVPLRQIANTLGRTYPSVVLKLTRTRARPVPDNLRPRLYVFLRLLQQHRRFEQADVIALAGAL
jgi:hypothetical protein